MRWSRRSAVAGAVFLQRFEQLDPDDQRLIADAIPALERLLDTAPCREES